MKELSIGIAPSNDVIIDERCTIKGPVIIRQTQDEKYVLHVLYGNDETFLNGIRLHFGRFVLIPGDELRIGDTIVIWEQYFPELEVDRLKKELRGISHGKVSPPPRDSAMCYCPAPPDDYIVGPHKKWKLWIILLLAFLLPLIFFIILILVEI